MKNGGQITKDTRNSKKKMRKVRTVGPVLNLEEYVSQDWWCRIFNANYLKTDADVVDRVLGLLLPDVAYCAASSASSLYSVAITSSLPSRRYTESVAPVMFAPCGTATLVNRSPMYLYGPVYWRYNFVLL